MRKLLAGSVVTGVGLAVQIATANGPGPDARNAPSVSAAADDGYVDSSERVWTVPRRAPRELIVKTRTDGTGDRFAGVDSSAVTAPLPAAVDGISGQPRPLVIAGIQLGTCTGTALQQRWFTDTRCDGSFKCARGRDATSSGYSLGKVSSVGWAAGAVNAALGAFLLVTNGRKSGTQTSIGADLYKQGGGLKIRREIW